MYINVGPIEPFAEQDNKTNTKRKSERSGQYIMYYY